MKSKQTANSRQNYNCNRKPLLDYLIFSDEADPLYITTSRIVRASTKFQDFYYEYSAIDYDKNYASEEEMKELCEFADLYEISNIKCLVEIMEILNDILYNTVFDRANILNWASKQNLTVSRVLYQNGKELEEYEINFYETTYFQPLKDRGTPAKVRTKIANMNYAKDYKISPHNHEWFYYVYKFEKLEEQGKSNKTDRMKTQVTQKDFLHNKSELTEKVLTKLKSRVTDPSGSYSPINASNFDEIMDRIRKN